MLDPNDGGWKSRKLWHSVFTSFLIVAGAVVCGKYPAMVPVYPEMAMALVATLSIFAGANVAGRWTIARNAPQLAAAQSAPEPAPTPAPKKKKEPVVEPPVEPEAE